MGSRELEPHLNGQPRKRLSELESSGCTRSSSLAGARPVAVAQRAAGARHARERGRGVIARVERGRRARAPSGRAPRPRSTGRAPGRAATARASASDSISGASSVAARSAAAPNERSAALTSPRRSSATPASSSAHAYIAECRESVVCRSLRVVGHPPDAVPAQRCPQQQRPRLAMSCCRRAAPGPGALPRRPTPSGRPRPRCRAERERGAPVTAAAW